jgi:gliding motility-associated transport system permease protein/gliding motility-associatede transport system auxiliary component
MNSASIQRIAAKETAIFFASPIGYLFLGVFLAFTLFFFFWVETFFARNIADVRPMFEWLPLLLLFLCSALTMRMWSEERRSGTLEFVSTVPVTTWSFVLGKFLACWRLLAIALLLTLPLPLTVAYLGNLDWGPILGGYLAAMLLGGAYIAIGLTVSARSDNQIVSLIVATLACGVLYLAGSPRITDLVGNDIAVWLRGIGTGSRFESITRGVLDFRDLYYYASLIVTFLALNVYVLERDRWARDGDTRRHHAWSLGIALLVANLLVPNLWLAPLTAARADFTEGRQYSISDATRNYLAELREPLLIRGYFSSKTHPLLAPLVPQMKDLLSEFEVAGHGKVRVEIVDPARDPEAEDEANNKYGIRPVPFQVADRHETSLVNSYFDVLVQYGDQFEVLGFRDLIEVKVRGESDLDVQLRNPEYDITRTIKKVLYGFQSGGELFASIPKPLQFVGYISSDQALPPTLAAFRQTLTGVLDGFKKDAGDKLSVQIVDPGSDDSEVAKRIKQQYGFRPMAASLFATNTFYFYMTLSDGGANVVQIPLPEDLTEEALKRSMTAAFKRFATGYLKSVALMAPETPQYMQGMGGGGNQYSQLYDALATDHNVERTQLTDGRVPEGAEVLVVADPTQLNTKQLFAIDQFLMQGGTVILAESPLATSLTQQSLSAAPRNTGLADWLKQLGVDVQASFVMDPQNAAFPVPVTRQVGGFSFQEIRMLDYPYFVDVRDDGKNATSPITSDLPQVTMAWASPIVVDADKNAGRTVTELLKSSPRSWRSTSLDVMPQIDAAGHSAYKPEGELGAALLGVEIEGSFASYFADKDNPLLVAAADEQKTDAPDADKPADKKPADKSVIAGIIGKSPESARLLLFSSNAFLSDQTLAMIGSAEGTVYGNSLQLIANAVDLSLEDRGLLAIRSRGHFNRTLPPLSEAERATLEYSNYGIALLALLLIYVLHTSRQKARRARYQQWLATGDAA